MLRYDRKIQKDIFHRLRFYALNWFVSDNVETQIFSRSPHPMTWSIETILVKLLCANINIYQNVYFNPSVLCRWITLYVILIYWHINWEQYYVNVRLHPLFLHPDFWREQTGQSRCYIPAKMFTCNVTVRTVAMGPKNNSLIIYSFFLKGAFLFHNKC